VSAGRASIVLVLLALVELLGAGPLAAQVDAPPWTACQTAYESGLLPAAVFLCNKASIALDADTKRVTKIIAKAPPYPLDVEAFVLDRGLKVIQVDYTKAQLTRKLDEDALSQRLARDTTIWALNLNAVLNRNDPMHVGVLYKRYQPLVTTYLQSIDAFAPGIVQRELVAGRAPH
jgi:hypothetical protein